MQLQVSLLVCLCHVSKRDYDASAIEKAVDTLDPHNGIKFYMQMMSGRTRLLSRCHLPSTFSSIPRQTTSTSR